MNEERIREIVRDELQYVRKAGDDDTTKIFPTQDDDPTQHISMDGKYTIPPAQFQDILDAAPVVDFRNPSTSCVAKELPQD